MSAAAYTSGSEGGDSGPVDLYLLRQVRLPRDPVRHERGFFMPVSMTFKVHIFNS